MNVEKYTRRPTTVDAVRVTDENMSEVAAWCDGRIQTTKEKDAKTTESGRTFRPRAAADYVRLDVSPGTNRRLSMAFAGDWVVFVGGKFRVYTSKAFAREFDVSGPTSVKSASVKSARIVDMSISSGGLGTVRVPSPASMPKKQV